MFKLIFYTSTLVSLRDKITNPNYLHEINKEERENQYLNFFSDVEVQNESVVVLSQRRKGKKKTIYQQLKNTKPEAGTSTERENSGAAAKASSAASGATSTVETAFDAETNLGHETVGSRLQPKQQQHRGGGRSNSLSRVDFDIATASREASTAAKEIEVAEVEAVKTKLEKAGEVKFDLDKIAEFSETVMSRIRELIPDRLKPQMDKVVKSRRGRIAATHQSVMQMIIRQLLKALDEESDQLLRLDEKAKLEKKTKLGKKTKLRKDFESTGYKDSMKQIERDRTSTFWKAYLCMEFLKALFDSVDDKDKSDPKWKKENRECFDFAEGWWKELKKRLSKEHRKELGVLLDSRIRQFKIESFEEKCADFLSIFHVDSQPNQPQHPDSQTAALNPGLPPSPASSALSASLLKSDELVDKAEFTLEEINRLFQVALCLVCQNLSDERKQKVVRILEKHAGSIAAMFYRLAKLIRHDAIACFDGLKYNVAQFGKQKMQHSEYTDMLKNVDEFKKLMKRNGLLDSLLYMNYLKVLFKSADSTCESEIEECNRSIERLTEKVEKLLTTDTDSSLPDEPGKKEGELSLLETTKNIMDKRIESFKEKTPDEKSLCLLSLLQKMLRPNQPQNPDSQTAALNPGLPPSPASSALSASLLKSDKLDKAKFNMKLSRYAVDLIRGKLSDEDKFKADKKLEKLKGKIAATQHELLLLIENGLCGTEKEKLLSFYWECCFYMNCWRVRLKPSAADGDQFEAAKGRELKNANQENADCWHSIAYWIDKAAADEKFKERSRWMKEKICSFAMGKPNEQVLCLLSFFQTNPQPNQLQHLDLQTAALNLRFPPPSSPS